MFGGLTVEPGMWVCESLILLVPMAPANNQTTAHRLTKARTHPNATVLIRLGGVPVGFSFFLDVACATVTFPMSINLPVSLQSQLSNPPAHHCLTTP